MPNYKINFFFEALKWGWSETYYAEYTDARAALEAADVVRPLRRVLLGYGSEIAGPKMTAIRVSNVDIQNDALVSRITPTNGWNSNGQGPADNPNLCLLIRCEATDLYRRSLYLRGNADSICSGMLFAPNPVFMLGFEAFASSMIARRWGILAVNRSVVRNRISACIQVPGEPQVEIETMDPHGLINGDTVRIVSTPGVRGPRGVKTVLAVMSPNRFRFESIFVGFYRGGGSLYKRTQVIARFTKLEVNQISHRITGRPFDSPVGRR